MVSPTDVDVLKQILALADADDPHKKILDVPFWLGLVETPPSTAWPEPCPN